MHTCPSRLCVGLMATTTSLALTLPCRLMCTHAEMYSLLLESYIKDPVEKHRLFHSIDTVPCIKRKAQWAIKWIGR